MKNKSGWLYEISFIRPLLVICLVSYHAFAPFCGAWALPIETENCESYKWIANFSRSFLLEAFVFLSGYVFTMQILEKHKFDSLKQLVINKFQRLILPCWIFGTIYFILFSLNYKEPIWRGIWSIFNGIGHLWYLPCLFWCFCFTYILLRKKYKDKLVMMSLIAAIIVSVIYIPLQINRALYYMFFFYLGGIFWKNKDYLRTISTAKNIFILIFIYIILLVSVNIFIEHNSLLINNISKIAAVTLRACDSFSRAVLATCGISMIYLIASWYMKKHTLSKTVISIGTMGYGVYVFHQFILKYLYYKTPFCENLGIEFYPWAALIITIVLSLILTIVFRKTKIGRKLI